MTPSDYEMVEQGYDPPRVTEPSVEEIVARWFQYNEFLTFTVDVADIRALIASWRERGEAAEAMRAKCEAIAREYTTHGTWTDAMEIADRIAALKDKP